MVNQMWSQEKYIQALKFAAKAHGSQKVPGSDLPYVVHVTMVVMEVIVAVEREQGANGDLAVQCALLHDVLEDTPVSFDDLSVAFGEDVAEGVLALTKNKGLPSKADRMSDSLMRIRRQPREIWMVKLADRITNLQPPPAHWPLEKISVYAKEALAILKALHKASPYLANRLKGKLVDYEKETQKPNEKALPNR